MAFFSDNPVGRALKTVFIVLALLLVADMISIYMMGKNASATFQTVQKQVMEGQPGPKNPAFAPKRPVEQKTPADDAP